MSGWWLAFLMMSCGPWVLAQDRPSEEALFGGSAPAAEKKDAFATGEATDNALQVGGIYYQRLIASATEGKRAGETPLAVPLQFDAFLDVRPNDRLRGFVDGRMFYDAGRGSAGGGNFNFTSISTAPTTASASNPQVVLDQAWLKFDIDRTVFVTAGKQHVKWGATRFWNPTDFLHTQRRDPLIPYDLRLGNSMVKFAVPWESQKASFYAVTLFDNPQPASRLGQVGGAFRAESVVFGKAEIGAEAIFRGGVEPVYGADLSSPLGPFDVSVEAACFTGPSVFYSVAPGALASGADVSSIVTTTSRKGPFFQVSTGLNYSFGWRDNRLATVGAEYFFNELGHSDPRAYPALIFFGRFQPFYAARHYFAFYVNAEGPDAQKKTSYTFSTLANLADSSYITRLDFSWRLLTYLTFETFVGVHYGTRGGEFRFAQSTPDLVYQGKSVSAVEIAPAQVDVGLALRLSL